MARMRLPRRANRRGRRAEAGFKFSTVDESAARRDVRSQVDRLTPDSVDEATGHVVDRLIDARAAQWLAERENEHESYRKYLNERRDQAMADLAQLDIQRRQDERRAAELKMARDAALTRVLGETPEGAAAGGSVTQYGDAGYADPALVAGRSLGTFGYLIALVFAVGADISAFLQVIERVMPSQPTGVALVLVAGFTAIVLALAHGAGAMLRDRKAGVRWVPSFGAPLCVLVWVALGLMAAWVRLKVSAEPASFVGFSLDAPNPASGDAFAELPAAATFLALYLGSGLVAAVGAYLTHNRMQGAYLKSVKAHNRAVARFKASSFACGQRDAEVKALDNALETAGKTLAGERQKLLAFAEELKQQGRMLIAEKAKDPAVTDAVTQFELRPRPARSA